MYRNPRLFLIGSMILTIINLFGSWAILLIQLVTDKFKFPLGHVSYASCDSYLSLKYSSFEEEIHMFGNIFIIVCCVLEILLLFVLIYDFIVSKPQEIVNLVNKKSFKFRYILNAITALSYLLICGQNFAIWKENKYCQNALQSYSLLFGSIATVALILKLVLIILSVLVAVKCNSILNKNFMNNDKASQLQRFLRNDTKMIRQALLSAHSKDSETNQNKISEYQKGSKFSYFNQKPRNKFFKSGNVFDEQKSEKSSKQTQRDFKGMQSPDPIFNGQKTQQFTKHTVSKLGNMGYEVDDKAHLNKAILTKKFITFTKPNVTSNNQTTQNQIKNQQQIVKNSINPGNNVEQKGIQEEIRIIITMDTNEDWVPQDFYKTQDLEPIALDQIFYQQDLKAERARDEELKRKMFREMMQQQDRDLSNQFNRMRPLFQPYIDEDDNYFFQQEQIRKYMPKLNPYSKNTAQQLCLHIKTFGRKADPQSKELVGGFDVSQLFREKIQYNIQKVQRKLHKKSIDSGQAKVRQKKNLIEFIRGKEPLIII